MKKIIVLTIEDNKVSSNSVRDECIDEFQIFMRGKYTR